MKEKIIICVSIILCLILPFNSVASGAAIAIGGLELLIFLLLATAAGITFVTTTSFDAVEEAQKMLDAFNASQFGFDNFNNWDFEGPEEPPENKEGLLKKIFLALSAGGLFAKTAFDAVTNFFGDIGTQEGMNTYIPDTFIYDCDGAGEEVVLTNLPKSNSYFFTYMNSMGNETHIYVKLEPVSGSEDYRRLIIYVNDMEDRFNEGNWGLYVNGSWISEVRIYESGTLVYVEIKYEGKVFGDTHIFKAKGWGSKEEKGGISIDEVEGIQYEYDSDKIRNVYPNYDILKDSPNVKRKLTPDGQEEFLYQGDFDNLVDEYIENTDMNNFFSEKKPKFEIGESEILISTETDLGTLPYPDTQTEPQETPQGLGKIITLLKQILNWVSKIGVGIKDIFVPDDDVEINFEPLQDISLRRVFPFCIPFDFYESIKIFAQEAKEPKFIVDLDTKFFEVYHEIDIGFMRFPIIFLRYVVLIWFSWFLMTKTRDFIKW